MKILHIFDLDDTLLVTPTFASMMHSNSDLEEFLEHIQQTLFPFLGWDVSFEVKGDFIVLVDVAPAEVDKARQILLMDVDTPEVFKARFGVKRSSLKDVLGSLTDREGAIIVSRVRGFHANPDTIGRIKNDEVIEAYEAAEHKMIVTGRAVALKGHIEHAFGEMGLELPDQGLYCFDQSSHKTIVEFKASCILEAVGSGDWDEVHFYEDRLDWLDAVALAVSEKHPDVLFVPHHIRNVHVARSLG